MSQELEDYKATTIPTRHSVILPGARNPVPVNGLILKNMILVECYGLHSRLNTFRRFWSDTLNCTPHHHHQNSNLRKYLWEECVHCFQSLAEWIDANAIWSCSSGLYWLNNLITDFMLGFFPLICHTAGFDTVAPSKPEFYFLGRNVQAQIFFFFYSICILIIQAFELLLWSFCHIAKQPLHPRCICCLCHYFSLMMKFNELSFMKCVISFWMILNMIQQFSHHHNVHSSLHLRAKWSSNPMLGLGLGRFLDFYAAVSDMLIQVHVWFPETMLQNHRKTTSRLSNPGASVKLGALFFSSGETLKKISLIAHHSGVTPIPFH